MKKAGLILLLITSNLIAQQIKSVHEELVDLQNRPLQSHCYDFGPYDFSSYESYELGWAEAKVFDSIFNKEWKIGSNFFYRNFETKYNSKGLKLEEIWFEKNDSIFQKREYEYNENDSIISIKKSGNDGDYLIEKYDYEQGLLVSSTLTDFNNKNEISHQTRVSNSYNDKKLLIKTDNYYDSELQNSLTYSYYDNNKPKELFITETSVLHPYNEEAKETTVPKHAWRYTDNNELMQEIELNLFINSKDSITATEYTEPKKICDNVFVEYKNSQMDSKILAVKNDLYKSIWWKNNAIVQIDDYDYDFTSNESKKVGSTVIERNEKNQEISRKITNQRGTELYTTEYDSQSRISKYKIDKGYPTSIAEHNYTYQNNLLTKIVIKEWENKKTITFDYKFDAKGNWTEQTKSVDGKPLFTLKRKIEYY